MAIIGAPAVADPAEYKPTSANGPGSNGYWRRQIFDRPGTHTWTAMKDGKVKVEGLGAGSGGSGKASGASAAWAEKTLTVSEGDVLTFVVGQGGAGVGAASTGGAGGSSSISGIPVGATPLVLTGAAGSLSTASHVLQDGGTEGVATGPWDGSNPGAKTTGISRGSPSSGSPKGPGFVPANSGGGSGWSGPPPPNANAGGGTHKVAGVAVGGRGLLSGASFQDPSAGDGPDGVAQPFWDLNSVDSSGGNAGLQASGGSGGSAGPGAGGGASANSGGFTGGVSAIGGGTGYSYVYPRQSGHGAGGGSADASNAGRGGDAIFLIFWDEVAA